MLNYNNISWHFSDTHISEGTYLNLMLYDRTSDIIAFALCQSSKSSKSPSDEHWSGNLWVVVTSRVVSTCWPGSWLVVYSCEANQELQLACWHNSWQWLQLINSHPSPLAAVGNRKVLFWGKWMSFYCLFHSGQNLIS